MQKVTLDEALVMSRMKGADLVALDDALKTLEAVDGVIAGSLNCVSLQA